jgi:four helix bundle protein
MGFQSLHVWQKSKNLAVRIYRETKRSKEFSNDFGFRDQIRRAAISIPSNIAEGHEMNTTKHTNHHLTIAKGSCAELMTQILIAQEVEYLSNEVADLLMEEANHTIAMLKNLIRARQQIQKEKNRKP